MEPRRSSGSSDASGARTLRRICACEYTSDAAGTIDGSGRLVVAVGHAGLEAGAGLDGNRVSSSLDKFLDRLRRGGDASLAGPDFGGNADVHAGALDRSAKRLFRVYR